VIAALGIGGMIVILKNFRKQGDYESGPGVVPEEYD
jgi:hypothetical protein